MDKTDLKKELDQVVAELEGVTTQYASLGAKIAGLEARRVALVRALPGSAAPDHDGIEIIGKYRTDDIVEILMATGTEMSINDMVAALHAAGRIGESYDNVSADLAYLVSSGRAQRIRRGLYTSINIDEPGVDPAIRIVIPVTQNNLNNSSLYLGKYLAFFPSDSIGGTSREAGQGRLLALHFDGLAGVVNTDIASDKKIFRDRSSFRRFYEHHNLRAGDKVAIERKSDYEYSLSPAR